MKLNFRILDQLINDDVAFAIYRLPSSEEIHLILQKENQPIKVNSYAGLNGLSGFVIAPFNLSNEQPIVVIQPDIHLKGCKEIAEFSETYVSQNKEQKDEDSVDISTTKEEYDKMFNTFQEKLSQNEFTKLVLSRKQVVSKSTTVSYGNLFEKTLHSNPNTFVYLVHTSTTGTWIGSTPELFLSEQNNDYATVALAGTQQIDDKLDTQNLSWDKKNRQEQQIVAEYMREQLSGRQIVFTESETYTFRVGNLVHLKTDFHFTKDKETIAELLEMIHPTPAVCGLPKEKAFQFINQTEKHSRAYYSGFIGNLSMNNQTDLFVNLRCMQIKRHAVVLYAGGGILTSSRNEDEWLETEAKMQTMLGVL